MKNKNYPRSFSHIGITVPYIEKALQFHLNQTFMIVAHAKRASKNTIKLNNEVRLYLSLDFKTPNMVDQLTV